MRIYKIINANDPTDYHTTLQYNRTDLRHWIINHLDLSIDWQVEEIKD